MPDNNTDPVDALDNVLRASFVASGRMRCQAPYRAPGSREYVHLTIGGKDGHNFSTSVATLTYYDERPYVTAVSAISPSFGPIRTGVQVIAYGTNFAPTGWCAGAPSDDF